MVKKSALFCLIFPIIGGLFKVKLMLVWLVSTMPYVLILSLALICPNREAELILLSVDKNSINRSQSFRSPAEIAKVSV